MDIPSCLATIILLISLLLICKEYPLYLQGFFLAALYLIHSLTFLLYVFVFVPYLFYKILSNIPNRKFIFKELISTFLMVILVLILLLPYLINYPEDWFNLYSWYDDILNDQRFQNNYNYPEIEVGKNFLLILPFPFPEYLKSFLRKTQLFYRVYNLSAHTIGIFFIGTIGGLFLGFLKRRKKLIIFNLSVILILIYNFLPYFYTKLNLLEEFRYRTFESFALPIVILATFFFEYVIKLIKKIVKGLVLKSKLFELKIKNRRLFLNISKYKDVILLFLLILPTFIVIRTNKREYLDYNFYYYYNDEYVEIILNLRNNAKPDSVISYPYLEREDINKILYDMVLFDYNISNTLTIHEFFHYMEGNHTNYLIFNNSEIPETWKDDIYYETYFNRYFGESLLNLTKFSLFKLT